MRAWTPPSWIHEQAQREQVTDDAPEADAFDKRTTLLETSAQTEPPGGPAAAPHAPEAEDQAHAEVLLPAEPDTPAPVSAVADGQLVDTKRTPAKLDPRRQTLERFPSSELDAAHDDAAAAAAIDGERGILFDTGDYGAEDSLEAQSTLVRPNLPPAEEAVLPADAPRVPGAYDAVADPRNDEGDEAEARDPEATKPTDAAAIIASFMGDDEDEDDDEAFAADGDDDLDDFDASPARPFPVLPAALGVAAVLVLAFLFKDQLLGTDSPDETVAAATGVTGATGSTAEAAATGTTDAKDPPAATGAAAPTGAAATAPTAAPTGTAAAGTGVAAPTGAAASTGAAAPTGAATATGTATAGTPTGPAPAVGTPQDPAAFQEALAAARSAYERHRLKDTREKVEAALKMAPNHPEALSLLSHVQLEAGEADAALSTADICVRVDAAQADCWLALAVINQDRNNDPEALAAWKKYVEISPDGQYATAGAKNIRRLEKKLEG